MTRVEASPLYELLKEKCDKGGAKPLDPTQLLSMVKTATEGMSRILNRTCQQFPDYTLHDEDHALRVTVLMHRLMGKDVAACLSVVDLAVLILAAYAHDLGMAVGRERREALRQSEGFKSFLLRNEEKWLEMEKAREAGDAGRSEHLFSQIFQDYLRGIHHNLSAEIVEGQFAHGLCVDHKSLSRPVALLAISHGEPLENLAELKLYPFAIDFRIDLAYLGCVLRLADFLDLDPARAPESLMQLIQPESEQSRREWRKHQANNFAVTDSEIRFAAQFDDFFEEKALRDTLAAIEAERRGVMEFVQSRPGSGQLALKLNLPLQEDIRSIGYLYEEFRFQLEYRQIMDLLMGTHLYRDERVFIRELLQNALDACRHTEACYAAAGRPGYAGKITVRRSVGADAREVIEIEDNGAGMTRDIIRDYFMRVGRSYYQSFAFRRKRLAVSPVSQFGIGILSCFMKSDYIEVETRSDPLVHEHETGAGEGLKLEIRGPYQFFVVRESRRPSPGTIVRVALNSRLVESLQSLVSRFLTRCPFKVEICDHGQAAIELRNQTFDFSDEEFSRLFVSMPSSFGYASRDLTFDGRFGLDLHGRMRFFLLEARGRRALQLRNTGKYSFVGFDRQGDALVNVKSLSSDVRGRLNNHLNQIRVLSGSFSGECRSDLDHILRQLDRICEQLMSRHSQQEVSKLWSAVSAQMDALEASESYQSFPACYPVSERLGQAAAEVQAFVRGEIRLSSPAGLLTQDGINLSGALNLPQHLNLGIGFLYNLDLCGQHRLSLTAARDDVLFDDKFDAFVNHLYGLIGPFLGAWFREEKIPRQHVQTYAELVPTPLAEHVKRAYSS